MLPCQAMLSHGTWSSFWWAVSTHWGPRQYVLFYVVQCGPSTWLLRDGGRKNPWMATGPEHDLGSRLANL